MKILIFLLLFPLLSFSQTIKREKLKVPDLSSKRPPMHYRMGRISRTEQEKLRRTPGKVVKRPSIKYYRRHPKTGKPVRPHTKIIKQKYKFKKPS